MVLILALGIAAGILFLLMLLFLLLAVIKKNKKYLLIAMLTFTLSMGLAAFSVYKITALSYHKFTNFFKPRTGDEIYIALFGKPTSACVRVINFQDQIIPKMDYKITLECNTCPIEMRRILALHPFEFEKKLTVVDYEPISFFNKKNIGDTMLVFTFKLDEYGNGQTIYTSSDSTKMYCEDVWD
jgi:hypothetical protein